MFVWPCFIFSHFHKDEVTSPIYNNREAHFPARELQMPSKRVQFGPVGLDKEAFVPHCESITIEGGGGGLDVDVSAYVGEKECEMVECNPGASTSIQQ